MKERGPQRLRNYDYGAAGYYFVTVCTRNRQVSGPAAATDIPETIGALKSLITCAAGFPLWRRAYYGHVIRGEADYLRIWQYIDANPARWAEDESYYAQES